MTYDSSPKNSWLATLRWLTHVTPAFGDLSTCLQKVCSRGIVPTFPHIGTHSIVLLCHKCCLSGGFLIVASNIFLDCNRHVKVTTFLIGGILIGEIVYGGISIIGITLEGILIGDILICGALMVALCIVALWSMSFCIVGTIFMGWFIGLRPTYSKFLAEGRHTNRYQCWWSDETRGIRLRPGLLCTNLFGLKLLLEYIDKFKQHDMTINLAME